MHCLKFSKMSVNGLANEECIFVHALKVTENNADKMTSWTQLCSMRSRTIGKSPHAAVFFLLGG